MLFAALNTSLLPPAVRDISQLPQRLNALALWAFATGRALLVIDEFLAGAADGIFDGQFPARIVSL
jgi:hypothetical protein